LGKLIKVEKGEGRVVVEVGDILFWRCRVGHNTGNNVTRSETKLGGQDEINSQG
jgi:hypothetical protein